MHITAALALLWIRIPPSVIYSMFDTIKRLVHRIRAAFGDSDITYGVNDIGDWWNHPQGVLQGNICGPAIWIAISSVVFRYVA